ncbi:MAG TPA: triose-phosphate isomerase [Candidatus Paceibacterota bacterium]|nr:triose-phosphate isomerase [Candidatus Paceibacterota bacterium]
MRKLIVANWKMNPVSLKEALRLFERTQIYADKARINAEVVICPPFPYIAPIAERKSQKVKLGAQDDFWENQGAYTGEVSPLMLKNSGVKYVIVGHSERRRLGETDEMINKKLKAALEARLKPILCVGEPKRKVSSIKYQVSRKGDKLKEAKNFVKAQLKRDLAGILPTTYHLLSTHLTIAYEPVWAISTNKNAKPDKPEDSLEMIMFIKEFCHKQFAISHLPVLYGGSITSKNAKSFLQYKDIDGALVGGASLKPEEFGKIIKSASK